MSLLIFIILFNLSFIKTFPRKIEDGYDYAEEDSSEYYEESEEDEGDNGNSRRNYLCRLW